MNICVIGGGNIGTYLAAYTSLKDDVRVWMYTSKPGNFASSIELIEEEKNIIHNVNLYCVTNDLEDAVKNADIIFITYPSFMIGELLEEINPYVKTGAWIGIVPGFGGAEFYKQRFIDKGCTFFGTQRVPVIARLKEYGKSVYLKQKNEFMKIAVLPIEESDEVVNTVSNLIDIPCIKLSTYLAVTLSPSNPVMHPSRLYELFKDYEPGKVIYDRNPLFYEEWGNIASDCLLKLDDEIQLIFEKVSNVNKEDVETIRGRFNVKNPNDLTNKINNACGFRGIYSPMIKVENGFIPDLESRYFTEDLPFGTCIIKGVAEIYNVKTPKLDEIITWCQKLLKKEYIIGDKLIGKDVNKLLIPQNNGISTMKDLEKFYDLI